MNCWLQGPIQLSAFSPMCPHTRPVALAYHTCGARYAAGRVPPAPMVLLGSVYVERRTLARWPVQPRLYAAL